MIDELLTHTGKYKGDLTGKVVKSVTTDFGLSFKTGEIVECILLVFLPAASQNDPFDELSNQILVMKGNKTAFVF